MLACTVHLYEQTQQIEALCIFEQLSFLRESGTLVLHRRNFQNAALKLAVILSPAESQMLSEEVSRATEG